MKWTVVLPWPSRDLHPNARVHWAKKARAAKAARNDAAWSAHAAGIRKIEAGALAVTAIFTPPDHRPRDADGMLSNIKSYLDGIADAIGVDDSKWRIAIRRDAPAAPGSVHIIVAVSDTWEQIGEPLGRVIAGMAAPKSDAA